MRNLPLYSAGRSAGHARRLGAVCTTFFGFPWGSPGLTPEAPRRRPGPPQKHPDSALRPPEHTCRLSACTFCTASCTPPPLRAPPARPPARASLGPSLCVPCAPGPIRAGRLKRTLTRFSITTHRRHFSLLHRRARLLRSPCVGLALLARGSLAGRGAPVGGRVTALGWGAGAGAPPSGAPLLPCVHRRACLLVRRQGAPSRAGGSAG